MFVGGSPLGFREMDVAVPKARDDGTALAPDHFVAGRNLNLIANRYDSPIFCQNRGPMDGRR